VTAKQSDIGHVEVMAWHDPLSWHLGRKGRMEVGLRDLGGDGDRVDGHEMGGVDSWDEKG